MKPIYLICNAHIDPVWQWEWDEGLAETLSTFRIAADFCEQFDGFVFNHNEALLYEWVEEYEPSLFKRIQSLVRAGKWHIMGGWYLQPDCNMPSGESILRQIAVGRQYFKEKFEVIPTTAVNFDSFGHSRGLVQLLAKSGFDSYMFFRPPAAIADLPAVDFCWVGYDGSRIKAHAANIGYNSQLGLAADKIKICVNDVYKDFDRLIIPWGIGNHGGGPSRIDLENIAALKHLLAEKGYQLMHSTPEAYFEGIDLDALPTHEKDLNPSMVGCYTSQVQIKQKHRELENLLLSTEKMASAAEIQADCKMDWDDIARAEKILLFNEFHDILPGSSVERAQNASLRAFNCALELLTRQRVKAFMAFASRQPAAEGDELPIFVYNPHPYPIQRTISCEFQLQDQNWSGTYIAYEAFQDGQRIPSQMEKEDSNINLDWRKRLICRVNLSPFSMTRITCRPRTLESKPPIQQPEGDTIRLKNPVASLTISKKSGLIHSYYVNGVCMLKNGAGKLLVIQDSADSWGMNTFSFSNIQGKFTLADAQTAAYIAGLDKPLEPVRIIEQGDVRTVVEAIFTYKRSAAIVRYTFDMTDSAVDVNIQLQWMEPNAMVKMSLPVAFSDNHCYGQVVFGCDRLREDGTENVAQQWLAITNTTHAFTVINTGSYASSYDNDELRLTLLRSAAYCGHPIEDRDIIPKDRFLPRIDMGERTFRFVLNSGSVKQRMNAITREAQIENEAPYALSFFPAGEDPLPPLLTMDNNCVILTSLKKHADGWMVRMLNPTADKQVCKLKIPHLKIEKLIKFSPWQASAYHIQASQVIDISLDGSS